MAGLPAERPLPYHTCQNTSICQGLQRMLAATPDHVVIYVVKQLSCLLSVLYHTCSK